MMETTIGRIALEVAPTFLFGVFGYFAFSAMKRLFTRVSPKAIQVRVDGTSLNLSFKPSDSDSVIAKAVSDAVAKVHRAKPRPEAV